MAKIIAENGIAAEGDGNGLGFGDGGCAIVFQHGCPNNAPLILWHAAKRFKPLFPNRGIPVELQEFFDTPRPIERTEVLWDANQYRMALHLLNEIRHGSPRLDDWELATALGLSSRHAKWEDGWLAQRMRLPMATITKLRDKAQELHLVDSGSQELTRFGHELLARLRVAPRISSRRLKKPVRALPTLGRMYYPDSCGGHTKH